MHLFIRQVPSLQPLSALSSPPSPPHDVTGDSREAPKVIRPLAITNTCFDRLARAGARSSSTCSHGHGNKRRFVGERIGWNYRSGTSFCVDSRWNPSGQDERCGNARRQEGESAAAAFYSEHMKHMLDMPFDTVLYRRSRWRIRTHTHTQEVEQWSYYRLLCYCTT